MSDSFWCETSRTMRRPLQSWTRGLAVLLISTLCAACPSMSLQHTARPVPVDQLEYSIAVGTYTFDDNDDGLQSIPLLEAQVRKGFTEDIDAGLKIASLSMLQADMNYAFIQTDNWVVSVDPTVSILPVSGALVSYVWLPVLADVITTDDLTLTLSARCGYVSARDIGDNDLGINGSASLWGGGVGLRYRLNERLAIMPEVHVLYSNDSSIDGEVLYSFTLGFVFLN